MKSNVNLEDLIKESNTAFIANLRSFLKIESTTLNEKGILEAKNYIISYISNLCEDIKECQDNLFLAKVRGKIKDFILIYMMYDTQPIHNEKEWITPPFGAEIQVLPSPLDILGKCIIARGAYNSKTPLMCFLNIVKILKEKDKLPISIMLLFDAQEEIGSPTLMKILEKNKEIFKECVDVYYPSTKQDIDGNAVIKLGYKGILSFTLKVSSTNKEPHSAFSSMIPNPAVDLVSLLNKIYYNNKFRLKSLQSPYILNDKENSIINGLIEKIDLEKIKKKAGITQLVDINPRDAFINYLFKPTFNISTLKSGYLKEGIKNAVPNQAVCNIDIRFAHHTSVNKIFEEINEIVENFRKTSKCDIEISKNVGYEGSRVNENSILARSLIQSFKDTPIEIWPLSPAAAPLSKINKELGLNFITGGLGIGGNAHGVNEFIQYNSIINTRLSNFYFLEAYAKLYKKLMN